MEELWNFGAEEARPMAVEEASIDVRSVNGMLKKGKNQRGMVFQPPDTNGCGYCWLRLSYIGMGYAVTGTGREEGDEVKRWRSSVVQKLREGKEREI